MTALYAGAALLYLSAIFLIVRHRIRSRRQLDRLDGIVHAAIDGTLVERDFDESRLSRLESDLVQYLRSAETSARHISEERDRIKTLISDISHQTKTPIANLCLYSEMLLESCPPDEAGRGDKRCEQAAAIHGQAQKLRFLIDALVKLSRIENGILALSPEKVPLFPMLEKVCEVVRPAAREKNLMLSLIPADAPLSAVCDPRWTQEALFNLADNAVKYTSSGGVTISASVYPVFVRIDVTDTGAGIAEEEQPRVFSRFYRGAHPEAEGVGLGLYLAREIIAREGGYIRLTSTVGIGSTFSVYLPRESRVSGGAPVKD